MASTRSEKAKKFGAALRLVRRAGGFIQSDLGRAHRISAIERGDESGYNAEDKRKALGVLGFKTKIAFSASAENALFAAAENIQATLRPPIHQDVLEALNIIRRERGLTIKAIGANQISTLFIQAAKGQEFNPKILQFVLQKLAPDPAKDFTLQDLLAEAKEIKHWSKVTAWAKQAYAEILGQAIYTLRIDQKRSQGDIGIRSEVSRIEQGMDIYKENKTHAILRALGYEAETGEKLEEKAIADAERINRGQRPLTLQIKLGQAFGKILEPCPMPLFVPGEVTHLPAGPTSL